MPKKEPLKIAKKRIFKDFLKEAKQHRPIVFYTDNDCDGMLAGSVLMSMCYRLGIKDFFFFSPLRNAHGYGFTDLAVKPPLAKARSFLTKAP
ncbi:DHH family protein [Helicobacter pylori]|nr:DHH family protein [Helicobacter pylori]